MDQKKFEPGYETRCEGVNPTRAPSKDELQKIAVAVQAVKDAVENAVKESK